MLLHTHTYIYIISIYKYWKKYTVQNLLNYRHMLKISSISFNLDLKMKSFIRMIQYTVRYRYYTNPFVSWQNEKTEIKIQTKRRSTLNTTDIFGTIIHEYSKTIFQTNIDVQTYTRCFQLSIKLLSSLELSFENKQRKFLLSKLVLLRGTSWCIWNGLMEFHFLLWYFLWYPLQKDKVLVTYKTSIIR